MSRPEPTGALEGRVAVITGATRNIGLATAETFARAGASLVVTGRHTESVERTAADLRTLGPDVLAVAADATNAGAMSDLGRAALERFGRVDIVVNNALLVAKSELEDEGSASLLTAGRALWNEGIDGYVHGPLALLRELVPHMEEGRSSVINVVSTAAFMTIEGLGVYGVTKAAMWSMTKYLAAELAPRIRVNALCPGTTIATGEKPLPGHEPLLKRVPLRRPGNSLETAQAALFLASDASSYTTGQVLFVDGGRVALS